MLCEINPQKVAACFPERHYVVCFSAQKKLNLLSTLQAFSNLPSNYVSLVNLVTKNQPSQVSSYVYTKAGRIGRPKHTVVRS